MDDPLGDLECLLRNLRTGMRVERYQIRRAGQIADSLGLYRYPSEPYDTFIERLIEQEKEKQDD